MSTYWTRTSDSHRGAIGTTESPLLVNKESRDLTRLAPRICSRNVSATARESWPSFHAESQHPADPATRACNKQDILAEAHSNRQDFHLSTDTHETEDSTNLHMKGQRLETHVPTKLMIQHDLLDRAPWIRARLTCVVSDEGSKKTTCKQIIGRQAAETRRSCINEHRQTRRCYSFSR